MALLQNVPEKNAINYCTEICKNLHLNDTNCIILKIRVAFSPDSDFIEVEFNKINATLDSFKIFCCRELDILPEQVVKIRKLPNIRMRNDGDIKRLRNNDEIDFIKSECIYLKPSLNKYESITSRDQIILY